MATVDNPDLLQLEQCRNIGVHQERLTATDVAATTAPCSKPSPLETKWQAGRSSDEQQAGVRTLNEAKSGSKTAACSAVFVRYRAKSLIVENSHVSGAIEQDGVERSDQRPNSANLRQCARAF